METPAKQCLDELMKIMWYRGPLPEEGKALEIITRYIQKETSKTFVIWRQTYRVPEPTEKPCDEAYRGNVIYVDTRTVDDPQKIPKHKDESTWWYEIGTNHRIEDGLIKRNLEITTWLIDIRSLEELDFLVEKYGDITVRRAALLSPSEKPMLEIELCY